jgi:hypothetical protein
MSVPPPPKGVCVKVIELRREYDNLEEWMADPENVLVTRHGRVFIKEKNGEKKIFHYKGSKWANPFKLSAYTLDESLTKYEVYLDLLLREKEAREEFLLLLKAKRIGCFVGPGRGAIETSSLIN